MPDRDDQARIEAQATLDNLYTNYWRESQRTPAPKASDLTNLEDAYQEALHEYAKLQGRWLSDAVLTSAENLVSFKEIRERMAAAADLKQTLLAVRDFIKLVVAIV